MRVSNRFPRKRLELGEVKRMVDAAVQKGIRVVSFTGGEPLLHPDDLIALIHHAGSAGIDYIRTGTNGHFFARPERPRFMEQVRRLAERLATTPIRNFWISIDSAVPEVHERMRGLPGVLRGIEKALPVFHDHLLFPSANLGINRNLGGETTWNARIETGSPEEIERFHLAYRRAFETFYRFVEGLGFTMVNSCYPMSIEPEAPGTGLSAVYAATSSEDIVRYDRLEKAGLFRALFRTVPEHRGRIRIFSPRTSLRALYRACRGLDPEPYPCRGGLDAFFVDSRDGNTYPCGYRGRENMGRFWDLDVRRLQQDAWCTRCDWECFRDPSELFGPILQTRNAPLALLGRLRRDPGYAALWREDLAYYLACDLFDGRKPPDYRRLARFSGSEMPAPKPYEVGFQGLGAGSEAPT
jgi:MoaA/NifB/PqqE/SkfB family radical SAM enzyme